MLNGEMAQEGFGVAKAGEAGEGDAKAVPPFDKATAARFKTMIDRARYVVERVVAIDRWVAERVPGNLLTDHLAGVDFARAVDEARGHAIVVTLAEGVAVSGLEPMSSGPGLSMLDITALVLTAVQALVELELAFQRIVAEAQGRKVLRHGVWEGEASEVEQVRILRGAQAAMLADVQWLHAVHSRRMYAMEDQEKKGSKSADRVRRMRLRKRWGFSTYLAHVHENDVKALRRLGFLTANESKPEEIAAALDNFMQAALAVAETTDPGFEPPRSRGLMRVQGWMDRLAALIKAA